MVLYLLRHADAEPVATSDAARRLTEKGRQQALRVGQFCEKRRIVPALILTSPCVRAVQTAQPVGAALGTEIVETAWLACGLSPEVALQELQAFWDLPALMLVGHEPDLSGLIANLIDLPGAAHLPVRKASLTDLELHRLRPGGAQLDFTIPCRLM